MFVRMFCVPDQSELGNFTRSVVDLVLVRLGLSIRLLPPPPQFVDLGRLHSDWQPYSPLFATVIDGPYVNVVSSNDPSEWNRLWTTNVTNLLVTTAKPPQDAKNFVRAGGYQVVIVPPTDGGDLHAQWLKVTPKDPETLVIVLPTPWTQEHANAIRDAILV